MGKTLILLSALFLMGVVLDWMQFKDELRDMRDSEERKREDEI